MWLSHKEMNRYSKHFLIRKVQIKTTIRHYVTFTLLAKKIKLSIIVRMCSNWNSNILLVAMQNDSKTWQYCISSQNKNIPNCDPAIPLLWLYSKDIKMFIYKNIYTNSVNFILIHLAKRVWGKKHNAHKLLSE